MNVNVTSTVHNVLDALKGSPILLLILILNVTVLSGFGYTLHELSAATARRDALIKDCLQK